MSEDPIPGSWALTTMQDIARVVGGGTPSTTNPAFWRDGDIPWITPADLSGYRLKTISRGARNITQLGLERSGATLLPTGTVLFSSRAPIGYVVIASNPVATNQGFKSFVLEGGVIPDYLYYYLQFAKPLALSLASGTTFQEISGQKAALIPVVVAPTSEQRRIVETIDSYLTRLDAAVANLERVKAKLKAYRGSVLKAAVEGRLVPTEASIARAEKREYEPAQVLLARILEERRRGWEEAELAKLKAAGKAPKDDKWKGKYEVPAAPDTSTLSDLPEGWCWATVEGISTKVVDGVHKKPDYVARGVPFVTVKNLTAGPGIDLERLKHISIEDHEKFIARANPERGDILVSKDGTLGVIRAVRTESVFSIFVSVAMVKPVFISMSDYLELALSSPPVQVQMVPKGSGLQHIHLEDLRRDCVPIPPATEQSRILEAAQRHISVIDWIDEAVTSNLVRLSRLRQAVLMWAFGGELVDQDPNDEPAETLLARIRAERGVVDAVRRVPGRRAKATG